MGSLGNAGAVVVFDFDKTIIDCDSDNWVADGLGATARFDELVAAVPWNTAVDKMMGELHEEGVTIDDVALCLKKAPCDPHVIQGIKSAYSLGCDLRVVSDANLFFIETILEHHGILKCFSEINTNPCYIDEEGRLRVLPYHDFHSSHHGCALPTCPPNMCKGSVIERIQMEAMAEGKTGLIYLGDGNGDYCPSLKLKKYHDYVMPRKNYPVWDLICGHPEMVKAEVHGWSTGKEQQEILLKLINRALLTNQDSKTSPLDLSHHETPISSMPAEVMPKVLPVL